MTPFIWLFLAMLCQNPNHKPGKTACPLTHVSTLEDGDDNGDTGHIPPKPPTPPAPPPPTNP